MKLDQEVFKEIAKKHNLHPSLVRSICTHPFIFAKDVIASNDDHTDIRFAYLFTIKLKNMFKEDKTKQYATTKAEAIRKGKEKQAGKIRS